MIEIYSPEISVDEIMEKISKEVARRQSNLTPLPSSNPIRSAPVVNPAVAIDLPRLNSNPRFETKDDGYHVNDFLHFHDQDFITNAYKGVLKRTPDSAGLSHNLDRLRRGTHSKIELLGRLRYSPEGKAKKVRVKGLLFHFGLAQAYKIPVLGYLGRLATAIVRLPVIVGNQARFEQYVTSICHQHEEHVNSVAGSVENGFGKHAELLAKVEGSKADLLEVRSKLEMISDQKAGKADLSEVRSKLEMISDQKAGRADLSEVRSKLEMISDQKAGKADLSEVRSKLEMISDQKAGKDETKRIGVDISEIMRQLRDHKLNILDQQRRLSFLLEEARKRFPEPMSTEQIRNIAKEEDQILDAMYVSFEDQFRGTRGDIKGRQKIYLPYVQKAGAGTKGAPILDIGCGRGEWLELCREYGLIAKGIDVNRVLVCQCQNEGLDVVEEDALTYLRAQENGSLGSVTGFHIIEHLPFRSVISLLDEVLRVLKPQGLLILETPNPDNLIVASRNFYMDPTHLRPLPCNLLTFIGEARGFTNIEIIKLHPSLEHSQSVNDGVLNDLINGPQDYALIAWKA
jgi:SAM-dependent methyltransferase